MIDWASLRDWLWDQFTWPREEHLEPPEPGCYFDGECWQTGTIDPECGEE